MAWLMKKAHPERKSIRKRMPNIHTINLACTLGSDTARVMKAIRATPVTPYVSNPSAVGPTLSPAF